MCYDLAKKQADFEAAGKEFCYTDIEEFCRKVNKMPEKMQQFAGDVLWIYQMYCFGKLELSEAKKDILEAERKYYNDDD